MEHLADSPTSSASDAGRGSWRGRRRECDARAQRHRAEPGSAATRFLRRGANGSASDDRPEDGTLDGDAEARFRPADNSPLDPGRRNDGDGRPQEKLGRSTRGRRRWRRWRRWQRWKERRRRRRAPRGWWRSSRKHGGRRRKWRFGRVAAEGARHKGSRQQANRSSSQSGTVDDLSPAVRPGAASRRQCISPRKIDDGCNRD
jgi:hypothetical protein